MRTLPRRLGIAMVMAVSGAALAGCGGDIVFGLDKDGGLGGGPTTPVDTGVVQTPADTGTIMNRPDTGVIITPADTGVIMMPQPDAGSPADTGPTLPPCPTTFPTAWPYANTVQSYKAHFWTTVGVSCALGAACHGLGTPHVPLIPEDANIAANLTQALTDLMSVAQPGGANALISNHHKSGAPPPNSFPFSADIQGKVDAFVAGLQSCSGCSNGVCNCTGAPAICTQ